MFNSITWEEETLSRIKDARLKQKQMYEESEQKKKESIRWGEIADTLQKAIDLTRQKQVEPYLWEALKTQSTWKNLLYLAKANKGLIAIKDAVTILVEAKVFNDREHARNVIYSTLYSHKNGAKRVREGLY
jgi:hypothetical protein